MRMTTIKRIVPNPPLGKYPSLCYAATAAMLREMPEEEPQLILFQAFLLLAFLQPDEIA